MKYLLLSLCVVAFWIGGSRCGVSKELVHISISQQPELVEIGGEVEVICSATAEKDLQLTYSWTIKDVKNPTYSVDDGVSVLKMSYDDLVGSQVVTCKVGFEVDESPKLEKKDYTVLVIVLLSITLPNSITATEGDSMNITCTISGYPLPESVTWQLMANGTDKFEKAPEENYKDIPYTTVKGEAEKRVFTLPIKEAALAMGGDKYRCVPPEDAANLPGGEPPAVKIAVKQRIVVHIDISQQPDQVEEGGEVQVLCSTTAKGGKMHYLSFSDGDGVDIESGSTTLGHGVYVLTVSESELGNSKVVVCKVQVEGKQYPDSANLTVKVAGPIVPPVTAHTPDVPTTETPVTVPLSIKIPNSTTATEGDSMNITCTISGYPLPGKVTWQLMAKGKQKFEAVPEENYKDMPYTVLKGEAEKRVFTLPIEKAALAMSGDKYRCVPPEDANNLLDSEPPAVKISVKRRIPWNIILPNSFAATEGNSVNITCTISGYPLPDKVTWQLVAKGEKKAEVVPEEDYEDMPYTVLKGEAEKRVFTLPIKEVTLAMSGDKYSCVPPQDGTIANSLTGDKPPTVEITVTKKMTLKVTLASDNVTVTEGDSVNITCKATGKQLPKEVTWQLDAVGDGKYKNIAKGDVYNMTSATVGKGETKTKVFNLTIKTVTKAMSGGQYKCEPQDVTYNDPPPVATLTVEDKVALKVDNVTATEGDSATITCRATGKPLPKGVTWQLNAGGGKGFSDITKSDVYDMTPDREKSFFKLTIQKVTKEMNGNKYKCNPQGGTYNDPPPVATLTVEDKGSGASKLTAFAVAVVLLMVLCGAVSVIYWKRHTLRAWLMDQDVVKVIKKQKRAKGYRYSKLPRDITTSMKHLE